MPVSHTHTHAFSFTLPHTHTHAHEHMRAHWEQLWCLYHTGRHFSPPHCQRAGPRMDTQTLTKTSGLPEGTTDAECGTGWGASECVHTYICKQMCMQFPNSQKWSHTFTRLIEFLFLHHPRGWRKALWSEHLCVSVSVSVWVCVYLAVSINLCSVKFLCRLKVAEL